MKKTELMKEHDLLMIESIGFRRAGIDDIVFDHDRDTFVYNRLNEIEKELFPLLTTRKELFFDKTPRPEVWKQMDDLKFSGWILIENLSKCDQFGCHTISGKIIFAKR